jgi:hypothetical protein
MFLGIHAWARHLDLAMRQEHRAGEKLFVNFAGQHWRPWSRRTTCPAEQSRVP